MAATDKWRRLLATEQVLPPVTLDIPRWAPQTFAPLAHHLDEIVPMQ
jgi:hypothetical protein